MGCTDLNYGEMSQFSYLVVEIQQVAKPLYQIVLGMDCSYFWNFNFSTEPFCLANYPSAFHSVMFNPVEPRLLATANSKEGVGLWDIRKPQR